MSAGTVHAGHRRRLRERFRTQGLAGFAEHEVLELLLTYAIPQRDVNPVAHALIDRFGSLSAVLEADAAELMRVEGVGEHAASLIALMPELFGCYQRSLLGERPVISTFQDAMTYCLSLFYGVHDEQIYLICLDQGGRVLHPALLRRGTIDRVNIYPREAVELALRYHAHAVLLAHNHPSGMAYASQADRDVTQMIAQALGIVGVRLIDHLVVCGTGAYSMARSLQGMDGDADYRTRAPQSSATGRSLREAYEEEPEGFSLLDVFDVRE